MAAKFSLSVDGNRPIPVPRKFLLKDGEINFVEIWQHRGKTVRHARHIPASPWELQCFPHIQENFELASQVCDTRKLRIHVPNRPELVTIEDLRKFANECESRESKQAKRYDEVSLQLLNQKHSQLVQSLRKDVIERFLRAFPKVLEAHPNDIPDTRKFIFGTDLYAPDEVRREIFALAREGHAYSQFIGALIHSAERPVTQFTAEMLVAAHCQGMPQALAALGERLCTDQMYLDALNCAVVAMEGDYREAKHIIENVVKHTSHRNLEIQGGGYMPLMYWLVHFGLAPEIRELLFKHKPEWRPLTYQQRLEKHFAHLGKGVAHD